MDGTIRKMRREYISIAKDLCYPEHIITRLTKAKSETQMENIMTSARKHKWSPADIHVYPCTINN